jgi:hypothetical protein
MNLRHTILLALVALLAFSACKNETTQKDPPQDPPQELADQLIGTWKSTTVEIQIKSFGGQEIDTTFVANESNSAQVLGYVSNLTTFREDGSFVDVFEFSPDSSTEGTGRWMLQGNSLRLSQYTPDSSENVYDISLAGDVLKITGTVDADADGVRDDQLRGESKRVVETP